MKWEPSKQLCIEYGIKFHNSRDQTTRLIWSSNPMFRIQYLNLPEFNEYGDLTRGSKSLEDVNFLDIGNCLLEIVFEDEVEHSESSSW